MIQLVECLAERAVEGAEEMENLLALLQWLVPETPDFGDFNISAAL